MHGGHVNGRVLGEEVVLHQGLVAEAGVFFDWDAGKGFFIARATPLLFSAQGAADELSAQALPPLPQDTDSPVGAERLDALVVLPLSALARCAKKRPRTW